jgi:23S rRNA pseudouridine1911/1915/1917 synthase
MDQPTVLFEDNHLLVINKPAGIPTAGVVDRASVHQWASNYIRHRYNKPGNVFVGVVSRLDTTTSGVLILARTSKAASRLSEQIREHKIFKQYILVAEGNLAARPNDLFTDLIFKDDQAHRMRIDSGQRRLDAAQFPSQTAELRIESVDHRWVDSRAATVCLVELITGRKHQIRVQFSSRGHAIWGDQKYGAQTPSLVPPQKGQAIALHSLRLRVTHPTQKHEMEFYAPPPATWKQFNIALSP